MASLTVFDTVKEWRDRGATRLLPLHHRTKKPRDAKWNDPSVEVGPFNSGDGAGLVLLEFFDVDLDSPEALALAPKFLPPTATFGRKSTPESHWIYRAARTGERKPREFEVAVAKGSGEKGMLVELRCGPNQQTQIYGFHDETGEQIEPLCGEPVAIDYRALSTAVAKLAAAVLIVRRWPGDGNQHEFVLALAGALLKAGWPQDDAAHFVVAIAEAAGDTEEPADRRRAISDTAKKVTSGDLNVSGLKKCKELLTTGVWKKAAEWLQLPASPNASSSTAVDRLVEHISESVEFFLDSNGDSWAHFASDDHRETHPVKSRQFRRHLIYQFQCGEKALAGVLAVLDARAAASGTVREVYLRSAWHGGDFYIDRGGPDWSVIRVTKDDWEQISSNECPVLFYRSGHTGELPRPERGGKIEELRELLQMEDGPEWKLMLGFTLGALATCGSNNVSIPHLQIVGGQGIGKSVKSKIVKFHIDPDANPDWMSDERTGTSLKDATDLAAAVLANKLLVFGNLSSLSGPISDLLCTISTGGFVSRRELYVTFGETGFRVRRSVILTAITDLAIAGDLIDRMIIVRPEAVTNLAEDQNLAEAVRAARPRILGALFSAIAYAIGHPAQLPAGPKPRMIDFTKFAMACLEYFGITDFLAAYNDNRAEGRETSLEGSPLYPAILALLHSRQKWTGTRDALRAEVMRLDPDYGSSRSFPKTALAMSNALRRIATNLSFVGIQVEGLSPTDKRTGHGNVRTLTISRAGAPDGVVKPAGRGNENVSDADCDLMFESRAAQAAKNVEF